MTLDRRFLLCGFAYAIAGMGLGIYMAASHNHALFVAHAHILLVGFVVSFIYGLVHKLWIAGARTRLAVFQFYLHQLSTLLMSVGLVLLYAGLVPDPTIGPLLGLASVGVLIAVVLMAWLVMRSPG
ncbi:TonB-dependent receptor [Rhodanobacter sp. T12-5]|uniref:TonB-dependent receptor n=1 Tax=Rhodanobacter sp. T12-5 TaxID=2024611 RepID=UPI0011EBCCD8|nr:TonB-dependent receptor [Rhodanobacter sp. T12-5]KAA0069136.1 TonB-dependent receptor [Rhodanobacter sp. T12-5]